MTVRTCPGDVIGLLKTKDAEAIYKAITKKPFKEHELDYEFKLGKHSYIFANNMYISMTGPEGNLKEMADDMKKLYEDFMKAYSRVGKNVECINDFGCQLFEPNWSIFLTFS